MMKTQIICLLFLSATLVAVSLAFPAEKSAPLPGAAEIDSVNEKITDENDARIKEISSDDLQIKNEKASTSSKRSCASEIAITAGASAGALAAAGAAIGTIIPVIGTITGAIGGAIYGALVGGIVGAAANECL